LRFISNRRVYNCGSSVRLIRRTLSGFLWVPRLARVHYYIEPVLTDQKAYVPSWILSWGYWSLAVRLRWSVQFFSTLKGV